MIETTGLDTKWTKLVIGLCAFMLLGFTLLALATSPALPPSHPCCSAKSCVAQKMHQ